MLMVNGVGCPCDTDMEHIATTAHRPIGHALTRGEAGQGRGLPDARHKWREILDPVTAARAELRLNATDLAVLRAILSYLPGDWINLGTPEAHICFASNRSIADRVGLSGDSTVNRALRKLEAAGVVERRAAANHKRYPRRTRQGAVVSIYGISLAPALESHDRVLRLVEALTERMERIDLLRCRCVDLLDRLKTELDLGANAAEIIQDARKQLRRVPTEEALIELNATLQAQLAKVDLTYPEETNPPSEELSNSDNQSKRHKETENNPTVNYEDICLAFPTLTDYTETASDPMDLERRADILAESLPDTASAWRRAKKILSFPKAYILLGYTLERGDKLRRPGAYIHALTTRCALDADLARQLVRTALARVSDLARQRTRSPC